MLRLCFALVAGKCKIYQWINSALVDPAYRCKVLPLILHRLAIFIDEARISFEEMCTAQRKCYEVPKSFPSVLILARE